MEYLPRAVPPKLKASLPLGGEGIYLKKFNRIFIISYSLCLIIKYTHVVFFWIKGCYCCTSPKEVQPSPPDQELQFDKGFTYVDSMSSPSIIIISVQCHCSIIVPAGGWDSTKLFADHNPQPTAQNRSKHRVRCQPHAGTMTRVDAHGMEQ